MLTCKSEFWGILTNYPKNPPGIEALNFNYKLPNCYWAPQLPTNRLDRTWKRFEMTNLNLNPWNDLQTSFLSLNSRNWSPNDRNWVSFPYQQAESKSELQRRRNHLLNGALSRHDFSEKSWVEQSTSKIRPEFISQWKFMKSAPKWAYSS
jgi:hypothetical protein